MAKARFVEQANRTTSKMMHTKRGGALAVIAIVILLLLVIGLWFYADFTKGAVTGALTRIKQLVP